MSYQVQGGRIPHQALHSGSDPTPILEFSLGLQAGWYPPSKQKSGQGLGQHAVVSPCKELSLSFDSCRWYSGWTTSTMPITSAGLSNSSWINGDLCVSISFTRAIVDLQI